MSCSNIRLLLPKKKKLSFNGRVLTSWCYLRSFSECSLVNGIHCVHTWNRDTRHVSKKLLTVAKKQDPWLHFDSFLSAFTTKLLSKCYEVGIKKQKEHEESSTFFIFYTSASKLDAVPWQPQCWTASAGGRNGPYERRRTKGWQNLY